MNKIKFFALGCLVAVLAACGHSDYKKTSTGLVYEIISNGKGENLKQGEYLKVNFKFVLNEDSVLQNTFGKMPAYGPVDTTRLNMHSFTDILPQMRVGDSAVIVQSVDTLKKMGQIPPTDSTFKPGSTIKMYVKIEAKFKDQAGVEADYQLEEKKQLQREIATIDAELKKKGINATKSANGVFVQITNPGNGPQVDTGKQVSVMYRGTNMEGKMFDSNLDSQFHHMNQPLDLVIGAGQVIPGWEEGLRYFKQGGKGKLYIPSMLAYKGQQTPSEVLKPYTNLVFDIEVVNVKDAPAQQQIPQAPPMQ